jgi:hypothetical protein
MYFDVMNTKGRTMFIFKTKSFQNLQVPYIPTTIIEIKKKFISNTSTDAVADTRGPLGIMTFLYHISGFFRAVILRFSSGLLLK